MAELPLNVSMVWVVVVVVMAVVVNGHALDSPGKKSLNEGLSRLCYPMGRYSKKSSLH